MAPTLIADAGTPLMWAGLAHLTIGNLLIGLIEAAIVRWRFAKRASPRLIASIVAANYLSCIAGYLLISAFAGRVVALIGGPLPVYSLSRIMVSLAVASFVVTILLEWPFFWIALSRSAGVRRSLIATVLANAASYLVLLAWYWLASATPARWGVTLVRANALPPIPNARIFYISPNGKDVMQMRLDGSAPRNFCALPSPALNGVLGFSEEPHDNSWELQMVPDWNQSIRNVARIGPGCATTRPANPDDWTYNSNHPDDLEASGKWSVWTGFWPWRGIGCANELDGTRFQIMAVEMPWLGWRSCNATVLPDDQLVFQLGEQIIRVDLKRRLAAAIAAGHGPVVILDQ